MIYLIGASHMGVVLKSWLMDDDIKMIEEFGKDEPKFIEFKTNDGNSINASSIYIGHYSKFWGEHLAKLKNDTELEINYGFVKLINSLINKEKDNKLFVFMTGQEHYHLGIQKYGPDYDFNLPWRPDLSVDSGIQIIPFDIISKQINEHLASCFANLLAIRKLVPEINIYNIVCPPPVHPSKFDRKIYRYKYYLIYQNLINEFSKTLNMNVMFPPLETLNELGMLKQEYGDDEVHGNLNYGRKVISQIKEILNEA